ncbi:MAG: hypothetical protein Q4E22_00575 [Coriobacteriia bacterium]|nr:hypothetical protein [Coriobacteriia bacterium]
MSAIQRAASLNKKIETIANVLGFKRISIRISEDVKSAAMVTSEGIVCQFNPNESEKLANVALDRYGVQGHLTLEEIDTMFILEHLEQLYDYTDETFVKHEPVRLCRNDQYERYFHSKIDKMAALARMEHIPYAKKRMDQYLSRQAPHVMRNNPLHMQFLSALKFYVFESNLQAVIHPLILRYIGTIPEHTDLTNEFESYIKDLSLSYTDRHEMAKRLLWKPYETLLRIDLDTQDAWNFLNLYELEDDYSASMQSFSDESHMRDEHDYKNRIDGALEAMEKGNIDLLIQSRSEPDDSQSPTMNTINRKDQTQIGSMEIRESEQSQEIKMGDWEMEIEQISDLLLQIAHPQETLMVPRYASRMSYSGSRIHPNAQIALMRALESDTPQPIWQKIKKDIRMQDRLFEGMDVFLLLDISSSMRGEKARSATDMAYCLIRGLERAFEKAQTLHHGAGIDVRTQLIAFAAGWAPLTELATYHPKEKVQTAYECLLHPTGEQTIVAGALKYIQATANVDPKRKILCLIVGDGMFADAFKARKAVLNMPPQVYVGHINIGKFAGNPITKHTQLVFNPQILPQKLREILADQLED